MLKPSTDCWHCRRRLQNRRRRRHQILYRDPFDCIEDTDSWLICNGLFRMVVWFFIERARRVFRTDRMHRGATCFSRTSFLPSHTNLQIRIANMWLAIPASAGNMSVSYTFSMCNKCKTDHVFNRPYRVVIQQCCAIFNACLNVYAMHSASYPLYCDPHLPSCSPNSLLPWSWTHGPRWMFLHCARPMPDMRIDSLHCMQTDV